MVFPRGHGAFIRLQNHVGEDSDCSELYSEEDAQAEAKKSDKAAEQHDAEMSPRKEDLNAAEKPPQAPNMAATDNAFSKGFEEFQKLQDSSTLDNLLKNLPGQQPSQVAPNSAGSNASNFNLGNMGSGLNVGSGFGHLPPGHGTLQSSLEEPEVQDVIQSSKKRLPG